MTESEPGLLISNYVNFCRNTALNAKDKSSLFKLIICNMKSVDRKQTHVTMFPSNPYLEWDYVLAMTANSIGDFNHCIALVNFLTFPDAESDLRLVTDGLRYLQQFRMDVLSSGFVLGLREILHMLILSNIMGLSGHHVLEQYTSRVLQCQTRHLVSNLTARMSDYRFTAEQYAESIVWVLRHCVLHPQFDHELLTFFSQRESVESAMRMKHMEVRVGRPRLLDKLAKTKGVHSVAIANGTSTVVGDGIDSFQNWITRVRFPNTISLRLKRRLYMVMAQPHVDPEPVVNTLVSGTVATAVLKEIIAKPEEQTIISVIDNLNIQQAPFGELTLFMRSCFRAFPVKDQRQLSILKYIQLYIAAYQHKELWKACWVAVYPLLSYQVIKDVEEFVQKTPLNQTAFAEILLTD